MQCTELSQYVEVSMLPESHALGEMSFKGFIECISYITQYEDYGALTNRTMLSQVSLLLRDKDGQIYRHCSGVPENE